MKLGIIIAAGALALGTSAFAEGLNRSTQGNVVSMTFTEVSGGPSAWSGIYNLHAGWTAETGSSPSIQVSADVELWAKSTLDNNLIYFHKAGPGNPDPAILNGTLQSNRGVFIGIASTKATSGIAGLDKLVQTTNYALGAIETAPPATVDLTWEGHESLGSGYAAWRTPDANGTPGADNTIVAAKWWRMGVGTGVTGEDGGGNYWYQIRCTPQFTTYQQAGRYELDPILVIAPDL